MLTNELKTTTKGQRMALENWEEIVLLFRKKVVKYKTIVQVAGLLDLDSQTVKKILKTGHKPHFLCQLKIQEWVSEQ